MRHIIQQDNLPMAGEIETPIKRCRLVGVKVQPGDKFDKLNGELLLCVGSQRPVIDTVRYYADGEFHALVPPLEVAPTDVVRVERVSESGEIENLVKAAKDFSRQCSLSVFLHLEEVD